MMLAWLSASLTIVAPSGARIGITPVLAVKPGLEGQDRLGVLERRQARLELLVEAHRAGDRPHRPGARAEALDRVERGLAQLRMRVQAEVVVARERDHLAAVDHAAALLLALDDPQAAVQALRLQLLDLRVKEGERVPRACAHRGIGMRSSIGLGSTWPQGRGRPCRRASRRRARSARSHSAQVEPIGEDRRDVERSGAQKGLRPLPRVVDPAAVDAVQAQPLHDHDAPRGRRSEAPRRSRAG